MGSLTCSQTEDRFSSDEGHIFKVSESNAQFKPACSAAEAIARRLKLNIKQLYTR